MTSRPFARFREVLGLVAVHDDLDAGRQAVTTQAAPKQHVGCATLDGPRLGGPVLLHHVEMDPGVRVHPLQLHDPALQLDRCVAVEFRAERVVREDRFRRREKRKPPSSRNFV